MRNCIVCQKEYQESTETQKYCDRKCKRAAYLKLSREEYLEQRERREKKNAEESKKAAEAGFGSHVIFRDDGGYNRQYLASDGTWTINRSEAARCLGGREADELAKKHGVVFFGGPSDACPSCDALYFRFPDDFDRWVEDYCNKIDADNPEPTERFIEASLEVALESADPGRRARALLRAAPNDEPSFRSGLDERTEE